MESMQTKKHDFQSSGGGGSNNLEDKPESLSLQELTAINCELLSLIFP